MTSAPPPADPDQPLPVPRADPESAPVRNTITGGTFLGPVIQGGDVRLTGPVAAGGTPEPRRLVQPGDEFGGHAFISYARQDAAIVDRLQGKLESAGIPVWRDTADLWPGEDWRLRVRTAIVDEALAFIACFSRNSIARTSSYQNEELVLAAEQLRLRPVELPWLIPVRLDDCEIPNRDIGGGRTLTSIQRVDLFGDHFEKGSSRLVQAVLKILRRG